MIKILALSTTLLAGSATVAFADMGDVQTGRSASHHHYVDHHPMHHYRMLHGHMHHHGVAANGHCGGVSDGTGAHGCGTATGGPVGGLTGRH